MTCARCGSHDIWDDNLWAGCKACGYAWGPDGGTMLFADDKPGLARHLRDIPGAYLPGRVRLERINPYEDEDHEPDA